MRILRINWPLPPRIKCAFIVLFSLSMLAMAQDDIPEKVAPAEEVSKKEVDDAAFAVPPPTILIPVFNKGKWKGYREEPLTVKRAISSDGEDGTMEMISPPRRLRPARDPEAK